MCAAPDPGRRSPYTTPPGVLKPNGRAFVGLYTVGENCDNTERVGDARSWMKLDPGRDECLLVFVAGYLEVGTTDVGSKLELDWCCQRGISP